MTITLTPEIEDALYQQAQKKGTSPEALALDALWERFVVSELDEPRDEWERRLLALTTDCGVSLSNEALSSEGLYD